MARDLSDPADAVSAFAYDGALVTLSATGTLRLSYAALFLFIIVNRLLAHRPLARMFNTLSLTGFASDSVTQPSSSPSPVEKPSKREALKRAMVDYLVGAGDFHVLLGLVDAFLQTLLCLAGITGVVRFNALLLLFYVVVATFLVGLSSLSLWMRYQRDRQHRPWLIILLASLAVANVMQAFSVFFCIYEAIEFNAAFPGFILDQLDYFVY